MNAPIQPMDPWAPGVRAADVPVVEGIELGRPFDDPTNGFETAASDIDTRKVTVTFFQDEYASWLRSDELTLPQLAEHIRCQTAAGKMDLPWLKLAIFGTQRSKANCLRTNENVLRISGIEGDHDAENCRSMMQ
jgi:hypothetical protein